MRVLLIYLLIAISAISLAKCGAEQISFGFHSSIEQYQERVE